MNSEVFPSAEELMPRFIQAKLPGTLIEEITERYHRLGDKYLTSRSYLDGRPINGMLYTDRIVNCREEVVDAVFCIIGQIFKEEYAKSEPSETLFYLLDALVQIYSGLVYMEETEDYCNIINEESTF